MKHHYVLILAIALLPGLAHAQTLQSFFGNVVIFLNTTIIPFLLGIAFLFFVVNAIRYFVIDGDTDDGKTNAKNLATYGILAFVVIVVFWGLVNLISSSIGLNGDQATTSDYSTRRQPANQGGTPGQAGTPSALCASGALMDENNQRCPGTGGPITPTTPPPIAPAFVPPIN